MNIRLILIFHIFTKSAYGFFYTLLPLVLIRENKTFRAYCPWNRVTDLNMGCVINDDVMGFTYVDTAGESTPAVPRPYKFINPSLQKWFTEDHCSKVKTNWATHKGTDGACKDFSYCVNVADDKSVCTCQTGFFGDPYSGCKQHCLSDNDCTSPLAVCTSDENNPTALNRCLCKPGYQGDGVMCYKNPCGTDRLAKCEGQRICVPTGPNDNDFKCVCPSGYYIDHNKNCVPELTVTKDNVLTLVGKNVENGSRLEVGDCFSFVLNDTTKSMFFHKNSGDSVYVKKQVKNDKQFSLFFIFTDEVTVFSRVEGGGFGLTKLYSMSNTLVGCKFGHVKVFDPSGHEVSEYEEEEESKTQESKDAKAAAPSKKPDEPAKPEAAAEGSTTPKTEKQQPSKPDASKAGQEEQTKPKVEQEVPQGKQKSDKEEVEVKPKPVVELHVRNLTEPEKLGVVSGLRTPTEMLKLVNQESEPGSSAQTLGAESRVSELQTGVSTTSDKSEL